MLGSAVTSGFSAKRASSRASGTIIRSWPRMACAQNATSREVSWAASPTRALNHWRSRSTMLIAAMGVPQIWEASSARLSNSGSAGVSRIS